MTSRFLGRQNQFSVFNPLAASPLGSVTPAPGVNCPACGHLLGAMSVVGPGFQYGRHQVSTQKKDFGPRIGFAYSPTTKAVVRGGFGSAINRLHCSGRYFRFAWY